MTASFWKSVFSLQWIIRAAISFFLTVIAVWGIAFKTADYVVAANVSSMSGTLAGLQSSLDRLNDAVRDNTGAATRLNDAIVGLKEDSALQNREIAYLRTDVSRISDAVQDAGIRIRISDTAGNSKIVTSPYSNDEEYLNLVPNNGFVFEYGDPLEGFDCTLGPDKKRTCRER